MSERMHGHTLTHTRRLYTHWRWSPLQGLSACCEANLHISRSPSRHSLGCLDRIPPLFLLISSLKGENNFFLVDYCFPLLFSRTGYQRRTFRRVEHLFGPSSALLFFARLHFCPSTHSLIFSSYPNNSPTGRALLRPASREELHQSSS